MTDMRMIEAKAAELNNDMELVRRAIRTVQSAKCNLNKQPGRKDFQVRMTAILAEEHLLKQVRNLLEPKEVTVPTMTQADVDQLDYDQVQKALKSIQSKKYHTRWLTDVEGDNDEFRNACKIEAMLQKRKTEVEPVDELYIRKSELQAIIDAIEATPDIKRERVLELLKGLM